MRRREHYIINENSMRKSFFDNAAYFDDGYFDDGIFGIDSIFPGCQIAVEVGKAVKSPLKWVKSLLSNSEGVEEWEEDVFDRVVVETVTAGEDAGLPGIVCLEDRSVARCDVVGVSEKTVTKPAIFIRDALELMRFHLREMFDRLLVHMKFRRAVRTL